MWADEVDLGEELDSGAEGSVYRVQGSSWDVVKVFNQDKRHEKTGKVQAMINNSPTDPPHDQGDMWSIIWPTEIVKDPSSDSFLGYEMPYKNVDQAKNAHRYARENLNWDRSSEADRVRTALNLALVVRAIHHEGHAMGDLNHQNILIKDEHVSLIGCDAFHIEGEYETYGNDTFFPRYMPPEGRGKALSAVRLGDRFGLGVHIFQLLMEGFHPYQAKGPDAESGDYATMIREHPFPYDADNSGIRPHEEAPDYDQLPKDIRHLFTECFKASVGPKVDRPTPEEWVEALTSLSSELGPDH